MKGLSDGVVQSNTTLGTHVHVPVHQTPTASSSARQAASGRSRTNEELNEHARWLWDRSPLGYIVVDRAGRVVTVNAVARSMFGDPSSDQHEQWLLERLSALQSARLVEVLQAANEGSNATIELDFSQADGAIRSVRLYLLSVCSTTIALGALDITANRQLQAQSCELKDQLRHLQRLELINDISAGVAHDFNNVLQVISGYAGILQCAADTSERAVEAIEEILTATERGATLSRKLLEFSRKAKLNLQPVDIVSIAEHCMKIVARSLPRSIESTFAKPAGEIICRVDARLLEQSLLNLLLNARDAMPLGGKLALSIERERHPVRSSGSEFAAGDYLCISVSDTGIGIPEELRERIFEPFFTTKLDGAGTGLGLALVQGIIADHAGVIEVESQVGLGTTFRVYLPMTATA